MRIWTASGERGAAWRIARSPTSISRDAVFPLRAALDKGVRVGLGTDISGGPSASMLDSCRMARRRLAPARVRRRSPRLPRERRGRAGARIDFRDAFHLATAGGGDALDLPLGRFAPGNHFDAIVVDPAAPAGTIRIDDDLDDAEDVLQKIIFTASRANIASVFVGGEPVAGAEP